jgi:hypothetical protein
MTQKTATELLAILAANLLAYGSLCAATAQPAKAQLETSFLRFTVHPDDTCELLDKQAAVSWHGDDQLKRFGHLTLQAGGKQLHADLAHGHYELRSGRLFATFEPVPDNPGLKLRATVRVLPDKKSLEIDYQADPALKVENISLLDNLVTVTDSGKGYVVVPVREGLLIPADSSLAFDHRFDTSAYEGCHMAMLGAVQNGAALLAAWTDPYVAADIHSTTNEPSGNCRQSIRSSLVLRKSASSFQLHTLGKGDYVTIAKAYRDVAAQKGLLVTWSEKLKSNPERAKLFGAANIKLWSALDRRMNEESTKEESVRVNWTFNEAAQVAEHYKKDLKLDNVLFTIGGWIHRGYDNQHPDILPTAPECGGDTAFSDCARRVLGLGYLFCLHDNYQDIYRDSPSWNEDYIMKTPDGKLARGGHWAGGLAFLTCSKMALQLAQRPQNLSAVKKLSNANSYFIDTTYAAGLQECFDPKHPLTRADDMKWKQALSDYARGVFGIFGSECGREWAIPHSDFFEGLTGVSGNYYHDASLPGKLGASVIPLFELVYHDCIAMYGKYGYDPSRAANYVLSHITIGRPLNYHSIPSHLYWTHTASAEETLALRPAGAQFKQTGPRQFQITYHWLIDSPPTNDWNVFVHFTDRAGKILFQGDYRPNPPVSSWHAGELNQGPFTVEVPQEINGPVSIRVGLFDPGSDHRAALQGRDDGERRYLAGRLTFSADKIQFQPVENARPESPGAGLFTRGDNGWTERLHPMDRFIKNTCEILCPFNELTAQMQMTRHQFLTPDCAVQLSVFGSGPQAAEAIVNHGTNHFTWNSKSWGKVVIPPLGFIIDSPEFVAFHTLNWNGLDYSSAPLFTLRSLDKRPLPRSRKIRIYHAFGPDQVRIAGQTLKVKTQEIVSPGRFTP